MSRKGLLAGNINSVTVIEHMIKPLLKSGTCVKCVDSEGEHRFIRDAVLLLNQVDIEHPIGCYIVGVCNGFINQYKAGGNSLLFFICQWTKAASLLCEMGIPIPTVIAVLRETIHDCVNHAEKYKIKLDTIMSDSGQTRQNIEDGDKVNEDTKMLYHTSDLNRDQSLLDKFAMAGSMNKEQLNDDFMEIVISQTSFNSEKEINNTLKSEPECLPGEAGKSYALESTKMTAPIDSDTGYGEESIHSLAGVINKDTIGISSHISARDTDMESCKIMMYDSIPVVNLKLKNLQDNNKSLDDEDDDEFAWFFTSDVEERQTQQVIIEDLDSGNASSKHNTEIHECIYNEESAYSDTNGIEHVLIASSAVCDTQNECIDTETDSLLEKSDNELIRDINDLRKGSETDKEILKKKSRRIGSGMKIALNDRKHQATSSSEDEFEDSFSLTEKKILNNKTDIFHEDMNGYIDGTRDFVTVQFTLNNETTHHDTAAPRLSSANELKLNDKSDLQIVNSLHQKSEVFDCTKKIVSDKAFTTCKPASEDIKICNTLLKSLGKESKLLSLSVLDNSRHFRVIHSVCDQPDMNLSDKCEEEWKVIQTDSDSHEILSPLNVEREETDDIGMDVVDMCSQIDLKSISQMEGNEKCTKDIAAETIVNIGSMYGKMKLVNSGETSKSDHSKMANEMDKSLGSLSGINYLLDQLKFDKKQSTCYDESKNSHANRSSVHKTVSSTLTIRSRHYNMDSDELEVIKNRSVNTGTKSVTNGSLEPMKLNAAISSHKHLIMDSDKMTDTSDKRNPSDRSFDSNEDSVKEFYHSKTCTEIKRSTSIDGTNINSQCNRQRCSSVFPLNIFTHNLDKFENNLDGTGLELRDTQTMITDNKWTEVKTKSGRFIKIVEAILDRSDKAVVKVICDIVARLESQGSLSMMEKLVDCYPVVGSKTGFRLVQGLVIKTSLDSVTALQKIRRRPSRVLLVNADITPTFRHKGYKSSTVSTRYNLNSFCNHLSKSESWAQQVTDVLRQLDVDLIFARGQISEEMMSVCGNLNIVAIETESYRKLKLLGDITETDLLTYIKLATEDNVMSGVTIHQLDGDIITKNMFSSDSAMMGEFIVTIEKQNPQTVVLSGESSVLVDLKEQEFWNNLHQVTSVFQTSLLLPGNGQMEFHCVEYLRERREMFLKTYSSLKQSNKQYIPLVYETIEKTFQHYFDIFHHSGFALKTNCNYDDYTCKLTAWKVACDTVCTILNVDRFIITGITSEMAAKDEKLARTVL